MRTAAKYLARAAWHLNHRIDRFFQLAEDEYNRLAEEKAGTPR